MVQIDKMGCTNIILSRHGWDIRNTSKKDGEVLQLKFNRCKHWLAVCDAIHICIKYLQHRSSRAIKELKKYVLWNVP